VKIFIRAFLATLVILVIFLVVLNSRGEEPPSRRYRTSDRPKHLKPGDLCYDAFVDGLQTCKKHDEEWVNTFTDYATTAEKRKLIDEMGDIGCQTFAVVWYDHCRWKTAEPDVYDCHHGEEP